MAIPLHRLAATVILLIGASTGAQQPPAPPTLEQRIAMLESGLATLETRVGLLGVQASPSTGESMLALAARIDGLERSLERLTSDIQRVERLADNAAREAAQARREATAAQQTARDAAMRAR